MARRRNEKLELAEARIMGGPYKNFTGVEKKYNKEGNRNFCAIIEDTELADKLRDDGWNIKIRPPREEGDQAEIYLPVAVSYNHIPPRVYTVTSRGNMTELDEDSVSILDASDISFADLSINASHWTDDDGNDRIKAYLSVGYFTIEADPFADKYDKYRQKPASGPDDEIPF